MSARCRIVCGIAAVLLYAGAGRAEEAKRVQKVYSVADLVIPMAEPSNDQSAPADQTTWAVSRENPSAAPVAIAVTTSRPPKTNEDELIRTITRSVAPRSWSERGGAGTIDYFPLTLSLVVNQTPAIQQQIADLLTELRRLQDIEVTVEVKFADITAEAMQNLQQKGILGKPGEDTSARGDVTFLDDTGVLRFLDGSADDIHTNVMQLPRLTMFNGQTAAFSPTAYQQFVTGLEIVSVGDRVEYRPKTEIVPLGEQIRIQSVVTEDRRSVRVQFKAKMTTLDSGEVPSLPITTPAASEEQGPDGEPRTVTHYIQRPKISTINVDRTLVIPDGHTAVLTGFVRLCHSVTKTSVPILGDLPILGDYFASFEDRCEPHHLLVLVTPRIRVHPEAEQKRTKSAPCGKTTICPCVPAGYRTLILPPIRANEAVRGEEPSEALILLALPPVVGVPGLFEQSRDNIQIVTERIADSVDAPRCYPLVGPARLHHCHWKCSVYYRETIAGSYPFSFRWTQPRKQVVYLDLDHLHLCAEGCKK